MRTFIFFVTIFFLCINNQIINAQTKGLSPEDSILRTNGEVYFKFKQTRDIILDSITKQLSIDNVRDGEVFAYANRDEFTRFLDLHINYTLLPSPGSLLTNAELNMGNWQKDNTDLTIWNFYPTYPQYLTMMSGFAASYPSICKLDTIGTSANGHLLLGVKISDSVNYDRGVPQVFFTSSLHGDETTGYVLMMHLIDSLLSSYGSSTRITNMIENNQIFINPLANPDGTYRGGDHTVVGSIRGNGNNIDLNRNFADPDPAGGQHPDGNIWQPETQAFMRYADKHRFNLIMNFHGGAEVVNYPWDTWSKLTPDDTWWQFVSNEYADTAQHYGPTNYFTDVDASGITNGYAWYTIAGGRQDYHNYFKHAREVTLEISVTKQPNANQLLNYWKYNYRSFFNYLEQSYYGVRGKVYDSVTYAPIAAKVLIPSKDADSSFVYSALPSGRYFRLIDAGTWTMVFSAPGYYSRTITGVTSARYAANTLNVKLRPINTSWPRSFYATAVSPHQIGLSWSKNSAANPVLVAFNTSNTFGTPASGTAYMPGMNIPGGGLVIYNGSDTTFPHGFLNPGTTYYYRSWSVLAGNTYSTAAAANATTDCGVYYTFPIIENFSSATTQLPGCWTQEASAGAIHRWVRNNSNNAGGTAYEMRLTSQSVNPGTTRLKTFFFNTLGVSSLTLTFKYYVRGVGAGSGTVLRVQSSTNGVDWANEGWSFTTNNANYGPGTGTVTIANNLNSATTMIAFVATGNLNNFTYWYIDDVTLKTPGYWVGGTIASPVDWNTVTNWGDGIVPLSTTNAYIPVRAYLPVVNNLPASPAHCNDLVIEKDATVKVNAGRQLNVNGNLILKAP